MSDEAATGDAPADDGDDNGNWSERRLCPDGGCVGVVNSRGECGTCGKVDPGFDAAMAARAAARAEAGDGGGEEDDAGDSEDDPFAVHLLGGATTADERDDERDDESGDEDDSAAGGDGDEWQDRKLCEDGACIGVVIDGRCNTCGRAG